MREAEGQTGLRCSKHSGKQNAVSHSVVILWLICTKREGEQLLKDYGSSSLPTPLAKKQLVIKPTNEGRDTHRFREPHSETILPSTDIDIKALFNQNPVLAF